MLTLYPNLEVYVCSARLIKTLHKSGGGRVNDINFRMTFAEVLLGRCPRSRVDLLKPHTAERVEAKQQSQKKQHDARAVDRCFAAGEQVFVKNY